ncbi:uncharacterized protein KD926_008384 [Aspergillus affinis]|uniref:uncharacterized protein n=1 Tax=Aspergillus affinis TaxID=1070780 RepID=UPI0022FE7647|nr:uncharacterized protein KD926_008384 [Aspergillus affinis]KAI9040294.1 hypothetical protein KD926_008384 [Aspergillus affinis]
MSSEQKQEQPKSEAQQPTEQTTTAPKNAATTSIPDTTTTEHVTIEPIQYTYTMKPDFSTTASASSAPSPQSAPPNGPPTDVVESSDSKCKDVAVHPGLPGVPKMDPDLMELWAKIQAKVSEMAARENKTVNENMELVDVQANLEAKRPSKRDKVKKCFDDTLTVIQKVGGFVADAASQVFAPAAQCYNAISFLIDAYKGYQGAFEGLSELFEECTDYLNRLEYYVRGNMDAKLSKLAAMQMDLFVRVCDKALELRYSYGPKFKMAVKVMFLADDGIQPFLGEMAGLVEKERKLVQAQTFLSSREAADAAQKNLELSRRVENVVTDMHARDKDVDRENAIKQALGLPKEPMTPWRLRYREYLSLRLPKTGQWVFNEPAFASWETGQSDANILAIEGGNGTGKSFLASAIIQHFLHKKSATETGPRLSTAYYFFEGEARDAVKNANNLETAAKSIVWQLTQAERNYKKSVAKICRESQEIDPSSISSELLFENPDLLDMNVTFYIVIDGLSGRVGEGMLRFLRRASAVKGQHVRVLLTVDSECFQHLASFDDVTLNSIPISSKSRPDVEMVIRSRMDSMLALRKRNHPDIVDLRARICRELYQATDGDYFRINLALDDISKRQYPSGILNALKNAGDGRTTQINREIQELNHNCSETEISEINEIIVWIQCYRESLSQNLMAAALQAAVGESSLLTLADKIKEKYPLFKITNKGEVAFRAPEVEESIPDKQRSSTQEPDTPETAVSPGEMAMVKHFLSTVCPRETYEKLDFEGFLNDKKQDRKPLIYKHGLHIQEARIAFTCLRLITGEIETPSEDLLSYAKTKFLEHLSAVNLALLDIEYKKRFGPLLIKLFTNHTSIDIALNINELPGESLTQREIIRQLWFKDDTTTLILRWLGDTAVTLDIDNEARDWVTSLLQSKDHRELLLPAAKWMATHLVQEYHFVPLNWSAHNFIVAFLDKFEPSDEKYALGSVNGIERVERWCGEVLKAQKDSLWHTQIGSTLQVKKHMKMAEDRFRQALALDPKNWMASTLLASRVQPRDGLAILKPVATSFESSGQWRRSPLERVGFTKMLFTLAEHSWHEDQIDAARGFWIRAVEVDTADYSRLSTCLQCYAKKEMWSDIMLILRKIDEHSTEHLHVLSEFLSWRGGKSFPHAAALQAALQTEQLEFLVSAYERSIELSDERGDRITSCQLLYQCGRVTHAMQNGSAKAVKLWRRALDGHDIYFLGLLISLIAPYYLQKADAAGSDTESVSNYLKKIETLLPVGVPESDIIIPPTVYIARYYWRKGNKVQAKQIARDIVKRCLDILSDDDEGNDLPAFNQLSAVFVAFGDLENALATRALMVINFPNAEVISCDGDCNRSWDKSEEVQWCQDCIGSNYEKECAQKIEQNSLPFAVCNKDHEFLHAPRMDASEYTTPGTVPSGEEVISFEEWLGRIERDYVSLEN